MRDAVIIYRSFYEASQFIDDKELRLEFIEGVISYGLNGKKPKFSNKVLDGLFAPIKPQIDANNKRYENGKKGGRPRKHTKEETEEAIKARRSEAYKEWRKEVLERDNNTCQICGSKTNLHAHHKKDFIEYPELRYDVNNGLTVCDKCHKKLHTNDKPSENQNKPSNNQNKPSGNQELTTNKPKEKEKVKDKVKVKDKENVIYGTHANIKLTESEYSTLVNDFTLNTTTEAIEFLSNYKIEKAYKTKSDYLTIRRWVIDAVKERRGKGLKLPDYAIAQKEGTLASTPASEETIMRIKQLQEERKS